MILYLEDITVSFDGFKALNALTLYVDVGRTALHHRPERRRQDHHDGCDHRQDAARQRLGLVWSERSTLLDLHEPEIAQAGIGRKFQKPTVFEHHTVFENLELALAGDKASGERCSPTLGEQRDRIDEVLEIIGLHAQPSQRRAGALSHGQKQWLEIGMLLMQSPQLLLVDEPVAGMTPQEIERTAELLTSLAGEHSVVVVEHDMEFVRSIAKTRHRAARRAACWPKAAWTKCRTIPSDRSVPGRMSDARDQGTQPVLRRQPHPVGCDLTVPHGSCTVLMGRNGMGKTTLLQMHHGACCRPRSGSIHVRRRGPARAAGRARARLGIGYVPQGREIFSQLTVEENLRIGLGACARTRRKDVPEHIFEMFPVLKQMATAPRRRSVRRPAAATGHRPRAGDRAEAADPRRTHRRHSAQHRARDRRRDHAPEPRRGPDRVCWWSRSCRSRGASPATSASSTRDDWWSSGTIARADR